MVWAAALGLLALVQATQLPTDDDIMRRIDAQRQAWDQEHMPAGFDKEVWHYMSRDQQIDVFVAVEAHPRPLTKDTAAAAMDLVKAKLKDPDSAKFHGVKRRGPMDYCGWVNAKNSFGGYEGDSVFFSNSKWTVLLDPGASEPKFCP